MSDELSQDSPESGDNTRVTPQNPEKTYTQSELDNRLAQNRRSLQKRLADAEKQAAAAEALRSQVTGLVESGLLPEGMEGVDGIRETLESLMTDKDRLQKEQESQKSQLETAQKTAEESQRRLRDWRVRHAIRDAAQGLVVDGAAGAGALEVLEMLLLPKAEFDADKDTITFPVTGETDGRTWTKQGTPAEAVKKLEADPRYASLFKASVKGGAGGPAGSLPTTESGFPDFSDFAAYEKSMRTNPQAIKRAMQSVKFAG